MGSPRRLPVPATSRTPRRLRRSLIGFALALVLLPVLTILAGIARMWPDPVPGYAERRGRIAQVQRSLEVRGEHLREDLQVISTSGLEVELAVLRPDGPGPHPLLVLLVGQRTGKEAVELFEGTGETAVAAISYPYDGEHGSGFLERLLAIPSIQNGLLDTTPAVMLALDALSSEPYVDPERIDLIGVSLGAILGPKVAALDPRFRQVWLMHGAGDLVSLIAHQMRGRIAAEGPRRWAARLTAALAGAQHFAPEDWVGRISPRKLLLVNALEDERMPTECVEVLHAGAVQPHEIIWLPGGHVRSARTGVVQELVALVLERYEDEPHETPAAF